MASPLPSLYEAAKPGKAALQSTFKYALTMIVLQESR
jgi:hypothetical protein